MGETMFIRKRDSLPKLVVECENLQTLAAVAKVVNESGLSVKVFLEYDIKHVGESYEEKVDELGDNR